jgi:hypothetical protein
MPSSARAASRSVKLLSLSVAVFRCANVNSLTSYCYCVTATAVVALALLSHAFIENRCDRFCCLAAVPRALPCCLLLLLPLAPLFVVSALLTAALLSS